MKKGLILVLFALVSVVSYSQITWNVKAGMTMNNVTKVEDSKMKLGYTVGVGLDYAINDMWAVQSGLNISAKGTKYEFSESGYEYKESINPIYLELPILAAVKFPVSDNAKLVVNAGPYLAFGLGGKAKVEETDENDIDLKLFSKEDGADKAALKRFDLGLQYGVGIEISEHYMINLSGQYGFINPINEKGYLAGYMYDNNDKKISPKNMSFAITVGYKF